MAGKILVTGATGFLGRHIVQKLLQQQQDVRVLVRDANASQKLFGTTVEHAEGDVMDICSLDQAMEDVSSVVHSAAVVSFWKPRFAEMFGVNVEGTANVVNTALAAGVTRMVHISSIATFGRTGATATIDEQSKWVDGSHNSPYAVSKYRAELEIFRGIEEGLPAVILNPGVILGAGNWNHGTPSFFRLAHTGLRLYPAGTNGFVASKDVADAVALVLQGQGVNGGRYILVNQSLRYQELFDKIARAVGKKPPGIRATPWMATLYGRLEEWKSFFSGQEPLVTRASAAVSCGSYRYNGSLAQRDLGLSYCDLDAFIQETGKIYLQEYAGNYK